MHSQPIGMAVIGYGYWGPNLVRNFSATEGMQVVAVADRDPKRLASATALYPSLSTTTQVSEVLRDLRVDAVAIATPVHTHFELGMAALQAGKHVFIEKPLAQTADEVSRLMEEADRRGLILMVDHTFLYTPAVRKIRQLIEDRSMGEIYYYNSTRASLGLFQSDVNVVWDLAVHDLSIIRYLLDEAPVAVSATAVGHVPGTPENMAHIALHFESRCVAHISVNWLSPVKVRQTFIGGQRKMVVYNDLEPTEKIKVYDRGITVEAKPDNDQMRIGYRAGDMWAPHILATEALLTEARHFADCVRDGVTPLSDGASGLEVVEMLEAASISIAARGAPIELRKRRGPAQVFAAGAGFTKDIILPEATVQ